MLPAIPRRLANNGAALISTRIPVPRSGGIGERDLPSLYPTTRPSSPGRVVIQLICHSGSSGCGFWRNLSLALLLTTCPLLGASQELWTLLHCYAVWIN